MSTGLYEDFSDKDSLISNLTLEETEAMLAAGEVDRGMIPKLESCVYALKAGVFRSHIINGTTPAFAAARAAHRRRAWGTVMHSTVVAYEQDTHPHPLTQFAARLSENIDDPAVDALLPRGEVRR